MKFETIKGVESDFDGAPEWALYVDVFLNQKFWSEGYKIGDRFKPVHGGRERKYDGNEAESLIIAKRRPVAEPKPDAEGWIEWKGGDCPVNNSAAVDIKLWDGSVFMQFDSSACHWKHASVGDDVIAYRLSKPEQLAWNGEGLPPVGVECEAMMRSSHPESWRWRRVKVVISGMAGAEKECLVYDVESTHPAWVDEFRPIRSPEEIEREKAIAEINSVLKEIPHRDALGEGLYDAGYRKIK